MKGGQLDMTLAIAGAAISALIGIPLGLLASSGGTAAARLMRTLDVAQSFPLLVLAIVIVSLTGNELKNIVIAIVIVNTPQFIRLVRSEALAVRASRFVEAARAIGASPLRVHFVHVLPNVTATILAQTSLTVGSALITVAALGFLGIGITPPTPTWGGMIREGSLALVSGHWWIALFPGLAIFVFVLGVNSVAEGIGRVLGPPE
jgi:peptide/nickel transport system permease protein